MARDSCVCRRRKSLTEVSLSVLLTRERERFRLLLIQTQCGSARPPDVRKACGLPSAPGPGFRAAPSFRGEAPNSNIRWLGSAERFRTSGGIANQS